MQIDIIHMPPAVTDVVDRQLGMTKEGVLRSIGFDSAHYWNPHSVPNELIVGSRISRIPKNLHKVIHISHDQQWVFETVFAMEEDGIHCLYTKMISDTVDIAISLNTIQTYSCNQQPLLPLSDIISDQYWNTRGFISNDIHSLVLPIYTRASLDRAAMQLIDILEGNTHYGRASWRYRPIYEHEPSLLEALIHGKFILSPFREVRNPYPPIVIIPDRWFSIDSVEYGRRSLYQQTYVNHPEFDSIVLSLISMRPSKISLTILISHAVEGLMDLSVSRHLYDPYHSMIPITPVALDKVKIDLSRIVYRCVMKYCQVYDIDFNEFGGIDDQSSVTITKNIYDEVAISIHDLVNDNYICFYTSFSTLSLATLGVGWYTKGI